MSILKSEKKMLIKAGTLMIVKRNNIEAFRTIIEKDMELPYHGATISTVKDEVPCEPTFENINRSQIMPQKKRPIVIVRLEL